MAPLILGIKSLPKRFKPVFCVTGQHQPMLRQVLVTFGINPDHDLAVIRRDHSLAGIRRDWADWLHRISPGGIIALHDTRVPAENPAIAELGSYQYFEAHIKHDARFELLEQVASLSVLRRRG